MVDQSLSTKKQPNIVSVVTQIVTVVAIVGGVVACLYIICTRDLTSRENALLGVVLALMSILATWIVAHIYGHLQLTDIVDEVQRSHKESLRMYALKAAEKVNNLSNELVKLASYLEQELEYDEYGSNEENLQGKMERLESAVYLVRTLKSVNDTSLSDWEGVIGDELDRQREEKLQWEEEVRDALIRLENLVEDQRQDFLGSHEYAVELRQQITELEGDLRRLSSVTGIGSLISRKARKPSRQDVEVQCPKCGENIAFRQRDKPNSVKALACSACGTNLVSRYSQRDGFYLCIREMKDEAIECPGCGARGTVSLDNFPGGRVVKFVCGKCGEMIIVSRTPGGIRLRLNKPAPEQPKQGHLTEEFLDVVAALLPNQPWPKGTHLAVAAKVRTRPSIVAQAITELIRRRRFNPQIDGVVYLPSASAPDCSIEPN